MIYRTIEAALLGKRIADQIIRKNPDARFIFTNSRVGDTVIELAWAGEYKRQWKIGSLIVITTKANQGLLKYFEDNYDDVLYISEQKLQTLFQFYKSDFGLYYRRKHPQILCTFMTANIRSDLAVNRTWINFAYLTRSVYHIPLDTPPCRVKELPQEEYISELVEKNLIIPGKTVIINPYARTIKDTPLYFFEMLAKKLMEEGYCVISSIYGDQKPIRGTKGIEFTLDKTIAVCNSCGCVVGARSGFVDLAAFSSALVVSVDNDKYLFSDYFNMDAWGFGSRVKNIQYQKEIEAILIDEILHFILERFSDTFSYRSCR